MEIIKFYKVNEPYGFLSNFAPYPIYIDKEVWRTVEHYFQVSKFEDAALRLKIKEMDSPMMAASEGRSKINILREDWDEIKELVMHRALLCKFLQHPQLRKQIILTGSSRLVEHTPNDSYWADGGDGTGKNRLGVILMEVRSEMQKFSEDPDLILPPWIAFPSIGQFDMFWRMGLGEEYLTQWAKYYLETDKVKYRQLFPENIDWEGIFD
jgi:N-glycosidase YbiA